MKITKFVLFGLVVMGLASCSQDVELSEFQEETAELISGNLKVKIMGDENANTRRKIHSGGHEEDWFSGLDVQLYRFDIGDALGVYCPEAETDYNKGLYKVEERQYSDNATKTLSKINGGVNYYKSKINDFHRVYAGTPADLIEVVKAGEIIDDPLFGQAMQCNFTATVLANVECSISEGVTEEDHYTVGDWKNAIFAGGLGVRPVDLFAEDAGGAGSYITLHPLFTALELDMEMPQNNIKISKIRTKGQVWKGGQAVDVNLVGECEGHLTWNASEYTIKDDFAPKGDATANQIYEMTITGNKELSENDKLRATMFFFPCGQSVNGFFSKGSKIPFKIQVIVEYTVDGQSETHYEKATFYPTITLGGHNNIKLGKIGDNGTASTKKLTFS